MMTTVDSNPEFETLKNKGNEKFKAKEYSKALSFYSEAINIKPNDAIAYSNRAICHINLKRYYEAIEDCDKALTLDTTLIKAYYRRALARKELSRFQEALEDYERVLLLDSGFNPAKEEITKLKNILSSDPRVDIKCCNKPDRFKSTRPLQEFELRNQYSGSKTYNIQ